MPTILAGFRRESNEMVVNARLATEDLGGVSSEIRRKQLRESNAVVAIISFDVAGSQWELRAEQEK